VRLLIQITAFVLLALWLPATQHCSLNAAGWLAHDVVSTDCCETAAASCADDGCNLAEGNLSRPSASAAKTLSPDLAVCLCVLCSHLSLADLTEKPALAVSATERPIDWLPTWQFSRRTALPARAPNA